jgi:periodic tryptophan protein 2
MTKFLVTKHTPLPPPPAPFPHRYVLKQQGHAVDMNCLAYSPDGRFVATGGDDAKVKVWDATSGYCFVTFAEHAGPVTGCAFPRASNTVFTSSADGSVRAFDLTRYRNFRTMVAPTPTHFSCVACDPSGEVVCAGAADLFDVWLWSVQTGRLLDIFSGHEGPVTSLAFGPFRPVLATGSWDGTVRVWDVFAGASDGGAADAKSTSGNSAPSARGAAESHKHGSCVTAVAFRPDGREVCSAGTDGVLMFWDVREGAARGFIEARRDLGGGRGAGELASSANLDASRHFTSVCYSADGAVLLAGGNTRFVCLYDTERRLLIQRHAVSRSRDISGTVEITDTRLLTDAGHVDLIETDTRAVAAGLAGLPGVGARESKLPGAAKAGGADPGQRWASVSAAGGHDRRARTSCVRFAPSNRQWAAAGPDGLLIYSVDEESAFDPADLDIDVTPDAVRAASAAGRHDVALVTALRLNETAVMARAALAVPPAEIAQCARAVPPVYLRRIIDLVATHTAGGRHLEHCLRWVHALLAAHGAGGSGGGVGGGGARGGGTAAAGASVAVLAALRNLQRALAEKMESIATMFDDNRYALRHIARLAAQQNSK